MLCGRPERATAAGLAVVGGHTVMDKELQYGMAVTGVVHPNKIVTNAATQPGDPLVLTKPMGTGSLATALKRGEGTQEARNTVCPGCGQCRDHWRGRDRGRPHHGGPVRSCTARNYP